MEVIARSTKIVVLAGPELSTSTGLFVSVTLKRLIRVTTKQNLGYPPSSRPSLNDAR
jgi:hypothetical protein